VVKSKQKTKIVRMTEERKMLLSFQRAISDLESGPLPDPLKYAEYDYALSDLIHLLISQLQDNEYRPKRAENFDMPKGEFAIRPGAALNVMDLSVLHRLASDFIVNLDKKLPSGVIAYRLREDKKLQYRIKRQSAYFVLPRYKRNRIKIEESWYNLWPQYREQLKNDLQSNRYHYVASTDITAFFEDVNLQTLGEILKKKSSKHIKQINTIIEIFASWALRDPGNIRQSRGLPQGINMSGVLANHYLEIVDEYLKSVNKKARGKDRIKWYRYCDDINILCKTPLRARAILLNIGRLLRQLGLNQNAYKTNVYSSVRALDVMFYSVIDNVSDIIETSKKKGAKRENLIARLRQEYKMIPRRDAKYEKKHETALFCIYNAARILDSKLLVKRANHDFERFPVRAKSICGYVRAFINMPTMLNVFAALVSQKRRLLLYNYQLAFLVTVFRNCKKQDKKIFKSLLGILNEKSWHWYVKVQTINTIFFYGIGLLRENHFSKFIVSKNKEYVRKTSLILLPLIYSKKDTMDKLNKYAKELDINISRMANFLIALTRDKNLALAHLRKFSQPNYVFVGDQIWRLWFIGLNYDPDVVIKFDSILRIIKQDFRNYQLVKRHLDGIEKFRKDYEN